LDRNGRQKRDGNKKKYRNSLLNIRYRVKVKVNDSPRPAGVVAGPNF
jgi:hypothetical protein